MPHEYFRWTRGSCKVLGGWVEVARVKARAQLQIKHPVRVAPFLITSAGQDSWGPPWKKMLWLTWRKEAVEIGWKSVHSNQCPWNPYTWHLHQSESKWTHALMLLPSHAPEPMGPPVDTGSPFKFWIYMCGNRHTGVKVNEWLGLVLPGGKTILVDAVFSRRFQNCSSVSPALIQVAPIPKPPFLPLLLKETNKPLGNLAEWTLNCLSVFTLEPEGQKLGPYLPWQIRVIIALYELP